MNHTIDGAFSAYWKNLVAKDSKLAQYPKSFQNQLKDAFTQGFMCGQTDGALTREVHKKVDQENRKN
jgi:hypothetical protein